MTLNIKRLNIGGFVPKPNIFTYYYVNDMVYNTEFFLLVGKSYRIFMLLLVWVNYICHWLFDFMISFSCFTMFTKQFMNVLATVVLTAFQMYFRTKSSSFVGSWKQRTNWLQRRKNCFQTWQR